MGNQGQQMILESQKEIISEALIKASLDDQLVFYHLSVGEITQLALILDDLIVKHGFTICRISGAEIKVQYPE